jgi:hypothetical protein
VQNKSTGCLIVDFINTIGQKATSQGVGAASSALTPKADINRSRYDGRLVPQ